MSPGFAGLQDGWLLISGRSLGMAAWGSAGMGENRTHLHTACHALEVLESVLDTYSYS